MRKKVVLLVNSGTHPQDVIGSLESLVGSWNGYVYNEGGGVISVTILHPRALDMIDAHPKLTRLPDVTDSTPVQQTHIDKLHAEVKASLQGAGKLDKNGKLTGSMTPRELHQHLHDLYKAFTSHLHPDF